MECCGRTEAGPAAVRRGPRLRSETVRNVKRGCPTYLCWAASSLSSFVDRSLLGVVQFPAFVADRDRCMVGFLNPPDHPGVDTEAFRDTDYIVGRRRVRVNLHAVSHVEYAVHLAPGGLRLLLDQPEQQWGVEQIVLDYVEPVDEVQDFGLSSSAAMDHAPDIALSLIHI